MNIEGLLKETKAKFDHNLAKHYLKEKYQSKLIFADQDGLWKATPELLTFLSANPNNKFVLLDLYENPIKVDRIKLLNRATIVYNEIMDEWYNEFEELRKQR